MLLCSVDYDLGNKIRFQLKRIALRDDKYVCMRQHSEK